MRDRSTLTQLTAEIVTAYVASDSLDPNEIAPLIHSVQGFWWTTGFMLIIGGTLGWYFWRKRYLGRTR